MKALLAQLGWTQAYYAAHCGVSEKTVYNWCHEPRESPGYKVSIKYLQLTIRMMGI